MANKKESFLLFDDSLDILNDLTDTQAGKLFKAIKAYRSNDEVLLDNLLQIAFIPIRNQIKRNSIKYDEICKKRAISGALGGKQKQANLASASKSLQSVANLPEPVPDLDLEPVPDLDIKTKIKTSEPSVPDDDKKFCFDSGIELLGKKSRTLIAREIKKHGAELIADVIAEMQAKDFDDTSKLSGYFMKMCEGKKKARKLTADEKWQADFEERQKDPCYGAL